jgi:hypothetical protein
LWLFVWQQSPFVPLWLSNMGDYMSVIDMLDDMLDAVYSVEDSNELLDIIQEMGY